MSEWGAKAGGARRAGPGDDARGRKFGSVSASPAPGGSLHAGATFLAALPTPKLSFRPPEPERHLGASSRSLSALSHSPSRPSSQVAGFLTELAPREVPRLRGLARAAGVLGRRCGDASPAASFGSSAAHWRGPALPSPRLPGLQWASVRLLDPVAAAWRPGLEPGDSVLFWGVLCFLIRKSRVESKLKPNQESKLHQV